MRYRLRTLLIALAVGPPVFGALWLTGTGSVFSNLVLAVLGLYLLGLLAVRMAAAR